MNMTRCNALGLVGCVGAASALVGCGTAPSIGVSDARVVETRHLGEIQRDIALRADLVSRDAESRDRALAALRCRGCLEKTYGQRRFVAESFSRLWMNPSGNRENDPFLQFLAMENQRTAIAASASDLEVELRVLTEASLAVPDDSTAGDEPDPESARFAELAKQFVDSVKDLAKKTPADSPTDALDRWHQISMWYFVRHLAAHYDMRRANTGAPAADYCEGCLGLQARQAPAVLADAPAQVSRAGWQYVVLVFEVHVNPGSQPNRAVGVRLRPVKSYDNESVAWDELHAARKAAASGSVWSPDAPAPRMLITELFPTRVYDLEEAALLDEKSAKGKATGGVQNASLSASAEEARLDQRRFLTRTGKHASFADATSGCFGWDFYPSNFQRFDKGVPEALGTVVWGQHPGGMEAYLEAGGRTCVAFALVDSDIEAVMLEVTQVVKDAPPLTNLETESSKRLGYFVLPLTSAPAEDEDASGPALAGRDP